MYYYKIHVAIEHSICTIAIVHVEETYYKAIVDLLNGACNTKLHGSSSLSDSARGWEMAYSNPSGQLTARSHAQSLGPAMDRSLSVIARLVQRARDQLGEVAENDNMDDCCRRVNEKAFPYLDHFQTCFLYGLS